MKCAEPLLESGAKVVISSRKAEGCRRAAELIEQETGRACLPIACHVGDWDACDAMVEKVYEQYDRIDVLVNNAGMSPRLRIARHGLSRIV